MSQKGLYGISYMGSKGSIMPSLEMAMKPAENFYDLFGGGFSVSHYMVLKSNKYKYIHYNEIKSDIVNLVKRAIAGDFSYNKFKPLWISREEFLLKTNDPYIRICWSYGNSQKSYLFSKNIEPYKKSMHQAIVFGEFDDLSSEVLKIKKWPDDISIPKRRIYLRNIIEYYRKTKIPKILHQFLNEKQLRQLQRLRRLERLQQLERLERLQRLEQLQQLERLERLQRLTFSSMSYEKVEIKPNSVVYCDIPYLYQGKEVPRYLVPFDRKSFLDWAASRPFPVYISEYELNDDRFECVYKIKKADGLSHSQDHVKYKTECLFINKKGASCSAPR